MLEPIKKINFMPEDKFGERLALCSFDVDFSKFIVFDGYFVFVMPSAVFFDMCGDRFDRLMTVSALFSSGVHPPPLLLGEFDYG